jgi:outer membrane protein assembly factor BamA
VLLVGLCAMLLGAIADAQFPPRPDRWCVDHPTFAEEIEAASYPTSDRIEQINSYPRLQIDAVTFEGASHLPNSVKAQIVRQINESDSDLNSVGLEAYLQAQQERVRDALRDRGYFYANVSAKASVLISDHENERVAVAFHVSEGQQYRLSDIHFDAAHVFPPSELRKHFLIQDGGVFNLAAIRQGIEALTWLYGQHGYLNFTASPDIRPDSKSQRISMTLDIGEDQQFRVRTVEVVGLAQPLSGPTLKTKMAPGQVFDCALIDKVFDENKTILPADASPRNDLQITQDSRHATVAIRFDFTRCR